MEMIIENRIRLKNYPSVLQDILIDTLKIPNPKYIEAQAAGRSVYGLNPYIMNFSVLPDDSLLIPRGLRQLVIDKSNELGIELNITDNRKMFDYIDINSSKIKFRGYQIDAVSGLTSNSSGILIAPAGSGKTVMGLSTIPMVGQPTLWLTHTGPLAAQAKERAEAFLPSIGEIGLIGKGEWKKGEILTIGMIQTLVRNVDSLYKMRDDFGMIIVDECLVAGTKITMLDGSEKDIEDVVDGDTTTFGVVSNKFHRNTDSTVKLRGNWGTIEGSPTHKMPFISTKHKVIDKLKKAYAPFNEKQVVMGELSEIDKDDYILVCESIGHTFKREIGTEKSRLLALIACDGHIEKNLRCFQVGIIKDKEWFIDEMAKNTAIVAEPDLRTSSCVRGDIIIRCYSKELISFLNTFIPAGKKHKLYVPSIMEYATMEDIKNFLQVVFDTEGGLNGNQITITMATPEFLFGVQHLLRKFGVIARVIPIKDKVTEKGLLCENYSRLAISGYDAFLFYKKIGFSMKRKQENLLEIVSRVKKFVRRINYCGVTYRCIPVLHKEVIKKDTVVYDFTTEKHLFFANGILSSNCHHVPSRTFLDVIGQFNSYYTYGLTATPNRRDKLEGLMYQAIGVNTTTIPIERVAEAGGIMLPVVVCRRIYSDKVDGNDLQRILRDCIVDNTKRTDIIIADVLKAAVDGHYCIVVSDRREHCEILYKRLSAVWPKTGIATGKYSKKYVQEQVRAYNENEITILVTTASLLGEGFDVPFLDRAFVTMPFRSETKTEQIIGRIQRSFPGKKDAVVFDYVDVNIGVLENQFSSKNNNSRSRVYNRLGVPIEYN